MGDKNLALPLMRLMVGRAEDVRLVTADRVLLERGIAGKASVVTRHIWLMGNSRGCGYILSILGRLTARMVFHPRVVVQVGLQLPGTHGVRAR